MYDQIVLFLCWMFEILIVHDLCLFLQIEFVEKGSVEISGPNETRTVIVDGLMAATTYNVYAVGQDDSVPPNVMETPRSVTTRTLDNLPPNFLVVNVTDIQGTAANLLVQMDEPSRVSYAVYRATEMACPASEQVAAVQNSNLNSGPFKSISLS